jgi:hypothetical protein
MPVERVETSKGPGYRWGKSGKIYYYTPNNEESRKRAKEKALRQERAIRSTGWKE